MVKLIYLEKLPRRGERKASEQLFTGELVLCPAATSSIVLAIVAVKGLEMSLPVLFKGYMMLQDVGADAPVPYASPARGATDFRQAYATFIKVTESEAKGVIARAHVDYLNDLDAVALAKIENWEPAAFVMEVEVDFRGDIRLVKDGLVITREDIFEYERLPLPQALLDSVPRKVDAWARESDIQFALTFLQQRLRHDAHQLFAAITSRAFGGVDNGYADSFKKWLANDGGTVALRDELALPFKSMFDDRKIDGRQNNAWWDAWTGIDSAKLAYREEFRVGRLVSSASADVEEEMEMAGPRM